MNTWRANANVIRATKRFNMHKNWPNPCNLRKAKRGTLGKLPYITSDLAWSNKTHTNHKIKSQRIKNTSASIVTITTAATTTAKPILTEIVRAAATTTTTYQTDKCTTSGVILFSDWVSNPFHVGTFQTHQTNRQLKEKNGSLDF